jgi:mxaJ protein
VRVLSSAVLVAVLLLPAAASALTVCADPNNLPFSNSLQQGFENKLVSMLGKQLHTRVTYVWWAQRRGFARHTLAEAKCDLWPGVASGLSNVSTTRPYYRSTYMFVTQVSRPLAGLTLDDPRLKQLTVGVQLIGYDGINTPPAQALAERGITQNVRGFMLYGNYRRSNPPAAIVDAVADGSVDVALVWGPVAGYFARRAAVPLRLEPIPSDPTWKMAYGVSIGMRPRDTALRQRVDAALSSDRAAIAALLSSFHIPVVSPSLNLAAQ